MKSNASLRNQPNTAAIHQAKILTQVSDYIKPRDTLNPILRQFETRDCSTHVYSISSNARSISGENTSFSCNKFSMCHSLIFSNSLSDDSMAP